MSNSHAPVVLIHLASEFQPGSARFWQAYINLLQNQGFHKLIFLKHPSTPSPYEGQGEAKLQLDAQTQVLNLEKPALLATLLEPLALHPDTPLLFFSHPDFISYHWQPLCSEASLSLGLNLALTLQSPPFVQALFCDREGKAQLASCDPSRGPTPWFDAFQFTGALSLKAAKLPLLAAWGQKTGFNPQELLSEIWAAFPKGIPATPIGGRWARPEQRSQAALARELEEWMQRPLRPCLFLDRDGIIIEDSGYPYQRSKLKLIPEVIPLIQWAKAQGWLILVISNQAGVAKAVFTSKDLQAATHYIEEQLLAPHDAAPHGWYYCPYHPKGKKSSFTGYSLSRKPAPGLILQAMADHNIAMDQSLMVGDKPSDAIALPYLRSLLIKGQYPLDEVHSTPIFANHRALLDYLLKK